MFFLESVIVKQLNFKSALNRTITWYLEHDGWRRAIQAEGDARSRQGLSTSTDDAAKPGTAKGGER